MAPSGGDDADDGDAAPTADGADDGDAAAVLDGDRDDSADASAALSAALDAAEGDPGCALCSKPADYFLYEPDSVRKFVCWEHVSPHSAAVDGEDARPGRPVALSL